MTLRDWILNNARSETVMGKVRHLFHLRTANPTYGHVECRYCLVDDWALPETWPEVWGKFQGRDGMWLKDDAGYYQVDKDTAELTPFTPDVSEDEVAANSERMRDDYCKDFINALDQVVREGASVSK